MKGKQGFQKGIDNLNWNGGRIKTTKGYITIPMSDHPFADYNGRIRQHRKVFEDYYRCIVLPWGDIHHKNGKKDDNRIENLEGMVHGRHSSSHHPTNWRLGGRDSIPSDRICSSCGMKNTYVDRYGYAKWCKDGRDGFYCTSCYKRSRLDKL